MAQEKNYTIENGVPLVGRASHRLYPFGSMEVGDSFLLADSGIKEIERVRSAVSYFSIRNAPKKFAVRQTDPITKTYRCWRTA